MLTLTTLLTLGAAVLAFCAFGLAFGGLAGPSPAPVRLPQRRHRRA